MHLRLKEGGEKDIFCRSLFGGDLERSEGDFLVVLGESICVLTTIMYDTPIKKPRTS